MRVLPVSWAGLAIKMSLSLIAALCVLPFLYHHNALPIVSYHSEWLAVLLGLLHRFGGVGFFNARSVFICNKANVAGSRGVVCVYSSAGRFWGPACTIAFADRD